MATSSKRSMSVASQAGSSSANAARTCARIASASGPVGSPWACSHASARSDCSTVIGVDRAELERRSGDLDAGQPLLDRGEPVALQRRRHALAVAHRSDLAPPRRPAVVPRIAARLVGDQLAVAPRTQPGVQVDDADAALHRRRFRAGGWPTSGATRPARCRRGRCRSDGRTGRRSRSPGSVRDRPRRPPPGAPLSSPPASPSSHAGRARAGRRCRRTRRCRGGDDQSTKLRLRSTLSSFTRRTHEKPTGLSACTMATRTPSGRAVGSFVEPPALERRAGVALDAVGPRDDHEHRVGVGGTGRRGRRSRVPRRVGPGDGCGNRLSPLRRPVRRRPTPPRVPRRRSQRVEDRTVWSMQSWTDVPRSGRSR